MIIDDLRNWFWKTTEYLIYAFFITFPFLSYSGFLYFGSTTRSVNLIALGSILGLGFAVWLFQKNSRVSLTKSPIFISLGVYIVSIFISALLGLSFATSFWSVITRMTGLWYFIFLGIFMAILWPIISERKKQDRLIFLIILSTTLYSILSWLGAEGLGLIFRDSLRDGFTFGNSTFAGMYIFGAFVLSIYYLYSRTEKKWWMYAMPVLLLINPNIISNRLWFGDLSNGFVGEARASAYVVLLSMLGMIAFWGISKIKRETIKKKVGYSLFALFIVGICFSAYSLMVPGGFTRELYLSQATGARPLVWEMSSVAIADRPLFGYGTDNFERVFEKHYDNRLLQLEYGNEAWFDKAHNIFVDQAVDNGLIGLFLYLFIYLVIGLSLLYAIFTSNNREDKILASLLLIYFGLHLAELQTAFDTSVSYPLLGLMVVLSAVLFGRARSSHSNYKELEINNYIKYFTGVILLLFITYSTFFGLIPFIRSQIVNGDIRTVGSAEKRIPLYPILFGSPIDEHAIIWRTATDFQRGIAENPKVLADEQKYQKLTEEISVLEEHSREYLKDNPDRFRAYLSLADILLYSNLFGVNKLEEAHQILDKAIELVPTSPQPYWMKAVGYIYMRKFDLAREYAQKGLALNPNIKQSQDLVDYVERSIQTFPEVDLFFFGQI